MVYLDKIFERLQKRIIHYSCHKHGCRVIQTGLEVFRISQKFVILQEILYNDQLLPCCYDYHGNHVIQKIFIEMGQIDPHERNAVDLGLNDLKNMINVINS